MTDTTSSIFTSSGRTVRLRFVRIVTAAYVVHPFGYRIGNYLADVRVLPNEPRLTTEGEADQVVQDEHLNVARGTRSDADGGNAHSFV